MSISCAWHFLSLIFSICLRQPLPHQRLPQRHVHGFSFASQTCRLNPITSPELIAARVKGTAEVCYGAASLRCCSLLEFATKQYSNIYTKSSIIKLSSFNIIRITLKFDINESLIRLLILKIRHNDNFGSPALSSIYLQSTANYTQYCQIRPTSR